MKPPRTLQEAIVYFSDPDRAFEYAVKLRWPDGKVICPRCSSEKNYFIKTRKLWLCRGCNKQFTLKVNTIFEDTRTGVLYQDDQEVFRVDLDSPLGLADDGAGRAGLSCRSSAAGM